VLAAAAGLVTLIATTIGVFNRLALDGKIKGVDEIAQFSMGWFAALGAAYATALRAQFNLSFVLRRIAGRRFDTVYEWMFDVGGIAVGVLLLVSGLRWLPLAATRHSLTLGIPLSWPYLAIPVLGGLLILFSVLRLVVGRELRDPELVRLPISDEEFDSPVVVALAGNDRLPT
jgi:TRAP-type C4-dicarboxylate transport system permease small subunit